MLKFMVHDGVLGVLFQGSIQQATDGDVAGLYLRYGCSGLVSVLSLLVICFHGSQMIQSIELKLWWAFYLFLIVILLWEVSCLNF